MNRGLIAIAAIAVAVVLFIVLQDDDSSDESEPSASPVTEQPANDQKKEKEPSEPEEPDVPLVEIQNGKPVGGVQEIEFESGETARFEVVADAPDELHLHTYDLYIDVGPGKPTEVEFDADIEGLIELESHSTGELLAEISVVPN